MALRALKSSEDSSESELELGPRAGTGSRSTVSSASSSSYQSSPQSLGGGGLPREQLRHQVHTAIVNGEKAKRSSLNTFQMLFFLV